MTILYITYIGMEIGDSGSGVRPIKMYEAMQELGYDIKLLCGEQGRGDEKARRAKVKEIEQWLEHNHPDFCYVESPTYPIMLHCDRRLFRVLRKKGIPVGYFYRDTYRKFPDLFPRRKGFINGLKELYLDILQYLTDRALRNVDIIYVPSEEAKWILEGITELRTLPPAGENKLPKEKDYSKTCIYVGGITEHYGGEMLLDAFRLLNESGEKYRLILVCRKPEWDALEHPAKGASWLEVHHTSGEGLEPLYAAAATAALIPKADNRYNNMAISVKLFEYMGHGLPIVSVKSAAMDHFMEQYGLGLHTEYNAMAFADAVREILTDRAGYERYCENARKALQSENLWIHRVQQVEKDLLGLKQG